MRTNVRHCVSSSTSENHKKEYFQKKQKKEKNIYAVFSIINKTVD